MRLLYGILIITICCSISCKQSGPSLSKDLQAAEKAFQENSNEETYNNFVNQVLENLQKITNENEKSNLLHLAALASQKMNKKDQEIIFLNNIIKNYPKDPQNKDRLFRMVELLHNVERHKTADIFSLCLIKLYPEDVRVNDLKAKVPKVVDPKEYMVDIAKSVFEDTIRGFSEKNAMSYVDACEAYAMSLPDDTESPEFLFKAAETSNTLRTYEKSFALYDWIINKHPDHSRAPISLFMKGFLFDGTFHDSANAAKYYDEFLLKFPDNVFAKDAKLLKANLGKTDEEVLQELMKKNDSGTN